MSDAPYGPDYGALIAALGRRVAALEARQQQDDRKAMSEAVMREIGGKPLYSNADREVVDLRKVNAALRDHNAALCEQALRLFAERDAARAELAERKRSHSDSIDSLQRERDAAKQTAEISNQNSDHWHGRAVAAESALERARNLAREWLSDRNTGPYSVCQESRDCGRELLAALETKRSG